MSGRLNCLQPDRVTLYIAYYLKYYFIILFKHLHVNVFKHSGSVVWWVSLSWVEEIKPTDNSGLHLLVL